MKLDWDASSVMNSWNTVKPTIDINSLLKGKKVTPSSTFSTGATTTTDKNKTAGLAKIASQYTL